MHQKDVTIEAECVEHACNPNYLGDEGKFKANQDKVSALIPKLK
jgi:hypothetical protein